MSYWVCPPGRARVKRPVGDALDVGVEDRVGPEAGGEDVGVGLGDLERLGAEVEVLADQPVDRLVEGQAVGRPLVLGGQGERAEGRDEGDRRPGGRADRPPLGLGLASGPLLARLGGRPGAPGPVLQDRAPLARAVPQRVRPGPGVGPSREGRASGWSSPLAAPSPWPGPGPSPIPGPAPGRGGPPPRPPVMVPWRGGPRHPGSGRVDPSPPIIGRTGKSR